MNRYSTKGIVLKRLNYAEADRIITFITPTHGKVSAMAKSVRKPKSKLAGGIELFSISSISLLKGRGELQTLTSTRIDMHFGGIVKDLEVMESGYIMLKKVDQFTDDDAGEEYYSLLEAGLRLLEKYPKKHTIICGWFLMQLMKLNGSVPNLTHEIDGTPLSASGSYAFSPEDGCFFSAKAGNMTSDEIKTWRVFLQAEVNQIANFSGLAKPAEKSISMLIAFVDYQA